MRAGQHKTEWIIKNMSTSSTNSNLVYLSQDSNGNWYWGGTIAEGPDNSGNVQFSQMATGPQGNRLEVIGIHDHDGTLHALYQDTTTGNWHWHGLLPNDTNNPIQFKQVAAGVGVGQEGNPFLQVIGTGHDKNLYLMYLDNSNLWHWFGPLTTKDNLCNSGESQVATGNWNPENSNGPQLNVVYIGASGNQLYNIAQNHDGSWNTPVPLATSLPSGHTFTKIKACVMAPPVNSPGWFATGMYIIALGSDNNLYLMVLNSGTNFYWFGQLPNPSSIPFTDFTVGVDGYYNLQVVAAGNNNLYTILVVPTAIIKTTNPFTLPSYWFGLMPSSPSNITKLAAAMGNGGNLQVISLVNGTPYLDWIGGGVWCGSYGNLPNNPGGTAYTFTQIATGTGYGAGGTPTNSLLVLGLIS